MLEIPLSPIPNQSFSTQIDSVRYDIVLKEANGTMVMDVAENSVLVITGARCLADSLVIPYAYLTTGNFFFTTMNDELPYYTEFSSTQTLYYLSPLELAALNG